MTNRMPMQSHRRWTLSTAVAVATLCSTASVAWAGEIKVGEAKLDVDDKGNLTASGRKGVVDVLDEVPGEDTWVAHIWAKLDNAAEGPLYFEFYQSLGGTDSLVWRYEEPSFAGGKYFTGEIELAGGRGFNKDRFYEIKAVQVSPKGKDLTLAVGKVKLIKTGKKPEKAPDDGEDKVPADQDALDSFAGGDEPKGDEPKGDEPPPPVEPKAKKGCSIDSDASAWNGAMLLLVLGAGLIARRRS